MYIDENISDEVYNHFNFFRESIKKRNNPTTRIDDVLYMLEYHYNNFDNLNIDEQKLLKNIYPYCVLIIQNLKTYNKKLLEKRDKGLCLISKIEEKKSIKNKKPI